MSVSPTAAVLGTWWPWVIIFQWSCQLQCSWSGQIHPRTWVISAQHSFKSTVVPKLFSWLRRRRKRLSGVIRTQYLPHLAVPIWTHGTGWPGKLERPYSSQANINSSCIWRTPPHPHGPKGKSKEDVDEQPACACFEIERPPWSHWKQWVKLHHLAADWCLCWRGAGGVAMCKMAAAWYLQLLLTNISWTHSVF